MRREVGALVEEICWGGMLGGGSEAMARAFWRGEDERRRRFRGGGLMFEESWGMVRSCNNVEMLGMSTRSLRPASYAMLQSVHSHVFD